MGDTDAEPLSTQPEEYTDSSPGAAGARSRGKGQPQYALRDLRRTLSQDELSTSGVQIMLLDKVDGLQAEKDDLHGRLQNESNELRKIRDDFHQCERKAAVLNERLKQSPAGDILLAAGSLFFGLVPSLTSLRPFVLIPIIGGAVIMLTGAVWRKVRR